MALMAPYFADGDLSVQWLWPPTAFFAPRTADLSSSVFSSRTSPWREDQSPKLLELSDYASHQHTRLGTPTFIFYYSREMCALHSSFRTSYARFAQGCPWLLRYGEMRRMRATCLFNWKKLPANTTLHWKTIVVLQEQSHTFSVWKLKKKKMCPSSSLGFQEKSHIHMNF